MRETSEFTSHLPSFSENLVVRSPRVSRFTVNKKAQSVYSSTPTLGCRDPPARHAHPARNSPCTAQPCGRGVATAHGWRAACGGRSPVGRAARRVCGPAERGPRDAFGRVRRALDVSSALARDAARRTAETNALIVKSAG